MTWEKKKKKNANLNTSYVKVQQVQKNQEIGPEAI